MVVIHESHVFKPQVETKFEVCDPRSFLMLLMESRRKPEKKKRQTKYKNKKKVF